MDTESTIEQFIVNEIMLGDKTTKIDPSESLISSGVLDSLALLRLIAFLEEQFNITVEDSDVVPENLETINDVVAFVAEKSRGS